MIIQKQKLVQIYFALRHSFYQLRKFLLKVFLYSKPEPIQDNNHKSLIKNIKQFGCDSINYNKLLEKHDSKTLSYFIFLLFFLFLRSHNTKFPSEVPPII